MWLSLAISHVSTLAWKFSLQRGCVFHHQRHRHLFFLPLEPTVRVLSWWCQPDHAQNPCRYKSNSSNPISLLLLWVHIGLCFWLGPSVPINTRIMKILMSLALTVVQTVKCTSINARGVTAFSYSPLQISYWFALSVPSLTCVSSSSFHFFFHTFLPKPKSNLFKTESPFYVFIRKIGPKIQKNKKTLQNDILRNNKIFHQVPTKSSTSDIVIHRI